MDSRISNTKRNIVSGLIQRFVSILLPFFNRTIILHVLGAEYTGLTGLFSSILEVLNIAELGFNTAIVYSLYKPMAENDYDKIRELVTLFRRIYTIVGTVIFVGGLSLMPFIPKLISGSYPNDINIYLLFLLYLINAAASYYLFAYKECLLIADQRRNIADNIRTFVNVGRYLLQFVVLMISHNFYFYVTVSIIGTLFTNLLIQFETKKRYSYFQLVKGRVSFPKTIRDQVKGLLVDRLSDTCRNSFDSIIITSFLGLTATAIYGNYYYIYAALYAIMLVMCNAMSASVGNSIVKETIYKNYDDLNKFTFLFSWIAGWCTACLACLYQPFMEVWAGKNLLLPEVDMLLFCVYFYIINMTNIRNQYISGTGIWWKLKIPCAVEAISNLGLNVILGKLFGISGVLIATIITIFFLNFMWRTSILFKQYFVEMKFSRYLKRYIYYFLATLCATAISYVFCLQIGNGWTGYIAKILVCIFVPNVVLYIFYRPLKQFSEYKKFLLTIRQR